MNKNAALTNVTQSNAIYPPDRNCDRGKVSIRGSSKRQTGCLHIHDHFELKNHKEKRVMKQISVAALDN